MTSTRARLLAAFRSSALSHETRPFFGRTAIQSRDGSRVRRYEHKSGARNEPAVRRPKTITGLLPSGNWSTNFLPTSRQSKGAKSLERKNTASLGRAFHIPVGYLVVNVPARL